MTIVNIAQRTDEWFEWRKTGITASMIPVIMGLSPYQTPYELWAELAGYKEPDDLSNNYHVQRGIAQEPEARQWYEEEMGRPYLPVCVEADHNALFKASLDGLFGLSRDDREVLEVKCPCDKIFDEILSLKSNAPTFRMYAAQVQWQLNCSDSDKGRLFFYKKGRKPIAAPVHRNDSFIAKAEKVALAFWKMVQDKTPPKMIEGRDKVIYHKEVAANEWDVHSTQYREIDKEVKALDEKVKALKAKAKVHEDYFKSLIPEDVQTFTKDGIRVTQVDRDGAIDYKKLVDMIQQEFGVVVTSEMFAECQKAGSTSYRITVTKDSDSDTENVSTEQPETTKVKEDVAVNVAPPAQAEPEVIEAVQDEPVVAQIVAPRSAESFFTKSTQSMFF